MVGTGAGGNVLQLARISLVNEASELIVDLYVKPMQPVTQYHTALNSITAGHIAIGVSRRADAVLLGDLLMNRTVVGHSIDCDLGAIFGHKCKDLPRKCVCPNLSRYYVYYKRCTFFM